MARGSTICVAEVVQPLFCYTDFPKTGTSFVWLCPGWQKRLQSWLWTSVEGANPINQELVTMQRIWPKTFINSSTSSGTTPEEWWRTPLHAAIREVHEA